MLYCIFQSLSAHALRGKYWAAWQKSSSLIDHLREASGSWIFLVHMFHCELISVILRPPQRKEQGHSKIQRRQLWNHKKRVLSNQSYVSSFDQWFLKNIIWHNFSQLKKTIFICTFLPVDTALYRLSEWSLQAHFNSPHPYWWIYNGFCKDWLYDLSVSRQPQVRSTATSIKLVCVDFLAQWTVFTIERSSWAAASQLLRMSCGAAAQQSVSVDLTTYLRGTYQQEHRCRSR